MRSHASLDPPCNPSWRSIKKGSAPSNEPTDPSSSLKTQVFADPPQRSEWTGPQILPMPNPHLSWHGHRPYLPYDAVSSYPQPGMNTDMERRLLDIEAGENGRRVPETRRSFTFVPFQ